jgi:hypothetical protein
MGTRHRPTKPGKNRQTGIRVCDMGVGSRKDSDYLCRGAPPGITIFVSHTKHSCTPNSEDDAQEARR